MRSNTPDIRKSGWAARFWNYLDEVSNARTPLTKLTETADGENLLWLLYLYSSPAGSFIHQKVKKSASHVMHRLNLASQNLKELEEMIKEWPLLSRVGVLAPSSELQTRLHRWIRELEAEADQYTRAAYEDMRGQYLVAIWATIRKGIRLNHSNFACVLEAAFYASDNARNFSVDEVKQLLGTPEIGSAGGG